MAANRRVSAVQMQMFKHTFWYNFRERLKVGNWMILFFSQSFFSSGAMNDTVDDLFLDVEEAVTVRCQENARITDNCSDPNEISTSEN